MAYQKTIWTTQEPINVSNLNNIEDGIEANDTSIGDITQLETTATDLVGAVNEINSKPSGTELTGVVKMFAGSTAPNGYLICDGSAVSRETYSDLFDVIGTTYGSGDESTTFNLPNLKGKVVTGVDVNDTYFNTLGKTGGNKSISLNMNNLPYHKLSILVAGGSDAPAGLNYSTGGGSWNSNFSEEIGANQQPINVLQPYMVMNYIIKY